MMEKDAEAAGPLPTHWRENSYYEPGQYADLYNRGLRFRKFLGPVQPPGDGAAVAG